MWTYTFTEQRRELAELRRAGKVPFNVRGLLMACRNGNLDIAHQVLNDAAAVDAAENDITEALRRACGAGRTGVAQLIIDYCDRRGLRIDAATAASVLRYAAKLSDLAALRAILTFGERHGANFGAAIDAALTRACIEGRQEVACTLIEHRSRIPASARASVVGPLGDACMQGGLETVRRVIEQCAEYITQERAALLEYHPELAAA